MSWFVLWLACAATEPAPVTPEAPPPDPAKAASLRDAAMTAYQAKDYAACHDRFVEAGAQAPETQTDAYNAACCAALAGRTDEAWARLEAAAALGYANPAHLTGDTDLASIGGARWDAIVEKVKANEAAWLATINAELYELYTADQADRKADDVDWDAVSKRDEARRVRAAEILAADGAKVSIDYYHAAMVYQHGKGTEDIAKAHELALKALSIEPVHEKARWLAAASEDRLLMREGKPQKWGTQFHKATETGPWELWKVDPTITDEERKKWNVPSLAEAQARADRMNRLP